MAYFIVYFVHDKDVKCITVVGVMKALVCCQRFPFYREITCFNQPTCTDNAFKTAPSLSELAETSCHPPFFWPHRLTTAIELDLAWGNMQRSQTMNMTHLSCLSELKILQNMHLVAMVTVHKSTNPFNELLT